MRQAGISHPTHLWVMVAASNDDQVLDTAADEQLALVEEAEVARPEVARLGVVVRYLRVEILLCLLVPVPVPLRLRGAVDPDLAHLVFASWSDLT